jgi:hypothetical protein
MLLRVVREKHQDGRPALQSVVPGQLEGQEMAFSFPRGGWMRRVSAGCYFFPFVSSEVEIEIDTAPRRGHLDFARCERKAGKVWKRPPADLYSIVIPAEAGISPVRQTERVRSRPSPG